jgi:ligand-binding sensor domain-containing protein/HPt (histidine-containing phosphotransfer) domain-containing protein
MSKHPKALLPRPLVLIKSKKPFSSVIKSIAALKFLKPFTPAILLFCSIIIAVCIVPAFDAYGQQKILQFKHLTVDDGLSSSIVRAVLQDYRGNMWFGTFEGLSRYDGTNVYVYKNTPSDSFSLPENQVRAIFEDHNKNLFIGTGGGLSQYDRDLDRFVNLKFQKTCPLYNIPMRVFRIVEDSVGNLWLATDNGLINWDRKNSKVVQYKHDPNNAAGISNNTMEGLYIDKMGRLWVATKSGVNLLNRTTGAFEHITRCKTHNEIIPEITFMDVIEDREGNIWFGSSDGLFCLEKRNDSGKMELTHYKNNPLDPNSLSNDFTRSLFIDHEGNLLIGTENGGINLLNRDNTFTHFRIEEFNSMSLNNESIHALLEDHSNNLWVCTWGGGVNIASNTSGFIVHYKNLPGAQQSLSFNIVSGFVEDRYGRKWVGTDGGGFNLFDEKTGQFTRYNSSVTKMKIDALNCITEGKNNELWMGSWEGGLIRFNFRDNKVTTLTTHNSSIPDNTYYSIAQDSTGDLWMGSYRHGLVHYQKKENKFTSYAPKQINTVNTEISVVRVDRNGHVYLGTNNSSELFIFMPQENRFDAYTIIPDTSSKSTNAVFDILIESDTCAWAATKKGLFRFNPVNGKHSWYLREDGGTETTVKGLTLDKTGILWITTNSGLYRFDYSKNLLKHFTASDGLQSNDFYRASIITTKNGTIFAGGTNGFNILSPDNYFENKFIPKVSITDFHLFNEKVKVGVKDSPLQKHISETKKLTLSYKQSVLTFYFAVMDFSSPDKNLYAYRMENFDKNWIYCGNRQDATYTNLNPGTYRFHVKGSNNDGVWNETGTTLELVITPPWWETGVARAGFLILFLILLLGIYYYFRGKQEQKHLHELVASQKKVEDIMKSIDEAIFTINKDMSINKEHSKTAEKIFGITEFEKQDIASLFKLDEENRASFPLWLDLAFKKKWTVAGWEKHVKLNPVKEVTLERDGAIYLSVHYQPIYENDLFSRVMVIVNDITHQKMVEQYLSKTNAEKELQMERVFGIVSNDFENILSILDLSNNVITLFESINFEAISEHMSRLKDLGRDLHTLKGSGGSMGFDTLSKHCDELETALQGFMAGKKVVGPEMREQIAHKFNDLKGEMKGIVELRSKLYSGKESKLSIDKTDYADYLDELKKGGFKSVDESIYRFRMLNSLRFSEFCTEFVKMVHDYAKRFGKNIEPLKIETPEARIERRLCKALKGPVTHIIRNAVDHGIEDDATREKLGKGTGCISMALRENNETIELDIIDNGPGLDPELIAACAVKKGVITQEQTKTMTDIQKQDLIFQYGFSTKEEATTISGRGIGMDAIKTDLAKFGGAVQFVSRVGQGTQMTLSIPKSA